MIQLILGGARSGKSRLAEQIAKDFASPVIYVATAQGLDTEMKDRITHHQKQRPSEWIIVEEAIELAETLQKIDQEEQVILIDCLTLWMSNLLIDERLNLQKNQCRKLLETLPSLKSDVILVSNETGLGVVPIGQISRRFVDETGRLHQQIGQLADRVIFCVAGFPIVLKGDKA